MNQVSIWKMVLVAAAVSVPVAVARAESHLVLVGKFTPPDRPVEVTFTTGFNNPEECVAAIKRAQQSVGIPTELFRAATKFEGRCATTSTIFGEIESSSTNFYLVRFLGGSLSVRGFPSKQACLSAQDLRNSLIGEDDGYCAKATQPILYQ